MSMIKGNSSFTKSIQNARIEALKNIKIAGVPIKENKEDLQDYIYESNTERVVNKGQLVNGTTYNFNTEYDMSVFEIDGSEDILYRNSDAAQVECIYLLKAFGKSILVQQNGESYYYRQNLENESVHSWYKLVNETDFIPYDVSENITITYNSEYLQDGEEDDLKVIFNIQDTETVTETKQTMKEKIKDFPNWTFKEKGLKDSKLEEGNKYTITGFFNAKRLSSYLKIISGLTENLVVYDDASIKVVLDKDKKYIYVEGKLSNIPLKYKFYFNINNWKQIVENETTHEDEEIEATKFNQLSYFYDSSKCENVNILGIISGLDNVDYEEQKVSLKDTLNNLSELNYGYKSTGLIYGNRYMIPKYLTLNTIQSMQKESGSNMSLGDALLNGEKSEVKIPLYKKNGNVRFIETQLENGTEYQLPSRIENADLTNLNTLVEEYKTIYADTPFYDSDYSDEYNIFVYLPIPSSALGAPDDAFKEYILNNGIFSVIDNFRQALYDDSSTTEEYWSHIDNYKGAIDFGKWIKSDDAAYNTEYMLNDGSLYDDFECTSIKYDISAITKTLSLAAELIEEDTNEELTSLREEYNYLSALFAKSNQIILASINSGATPKTENVEDYEYYLYLDFSKYASLLGASSGKQYPIDSGLSGRAVSRSTKSSPDSLLIELLYNLYTMKIKSTSRNIDLTYKLFNCCWYDANGNLVDPEINQLKFDLNADDYIAPYMSKILQLVPYNEFEKENIGMDELKYAYYDKSTTSTGNFAIIPLNDNLDDIELESHTLEELATILGIPYQDENSSGSGDLIDAGLLDASASPKGGGVSFEPGMPSPTVRFSEAPSHLLEPVLLILKQFPEIESKLFTVIYDSGYDSYKELLRDAPCNDPYMNYQYYINGLEESGDSGMVVKDGHLDAVDINDSETEDDSKNMQAQTFCITILNVEEYAKLYKLYTRNSIDISQYEGMYTIYHSGIIELISGGLSPYQTITTSFYIKNYGWVDSSSDSGNIGRVDEKPTFDYMG